MENCPRCGCVGTIGCSHLDCPRADLWAEATKELPTQSAVDHAEDAEPKEEKPKKDKKQKGLFD